ncbi:hypothetical protein PLICRDRAFT_174858 [Plicaturopsis crispa FD-325 SS-3]|nr:hypothetical protein PLICRDRAFT_174858 [Plicaturopsis crispa FD-325 SS-3]
MAAVSAAVRLASTHSVEEQGVDTPGPYLEELEPTDQTLDFPMPPSRSSSSRSIGIAPHAAVGSTSSFRTSPERFRRDTLTEVPEEMGNGETGEDADEDADDDFDEEWELEEQGLYKGSYRRLITVYSLVPLSALIAFLFFAFLPSLVWRRSLRSAQPHAKGFPSPLPELVVSAAVWSLSHHIRIPLFSFFSFVIRRPTPTIIISTVLHVVINNLLRLSTLALLLVRHQMEYPYPTWRDHAFYRVWWIALGFSLAEVTAGTVQGYEQISLYRDVLVPEGRVREFLGASTSRATDGDANGLGHSSDATDDLQPRPISKNKKYHHTVQGVQEYQLVNPAVSLEVERDLDQLLAFKAREELEEVYGVPFIKIPAFVSGLQRIGSIIFSLGAMLALSASYLRSPLSASVSIDGHGRDPQYPPHATDRPFYVTFPIVVLVHLVLSLLHTPLILPRIGMHVVAYVGLLIALGTFFSGLGLWGALS